MWPLITAALSVLSQDEQAQKAKKQNMVNAAMGDTSQPAQRPDPTKALVGLGDAIAGMNAPEQTKPGQMQPLNDDQKGNIIRDYLGRTMGSPDAYKNDPGPGPWTSW